MSVIFSAITHPDPTLPHSGVWQSIQDTAVCQAWVWGWRDLGRDLAASYLAQLETREGEDRATTWTMGGPRETT